MGNIILRFRAFESLRYREYRLIWYGQIFASMGQWMDEVTRGWLMYQLTNSAVQLGLVIGIQAIPYLLLSPLALVLMVLAGSCNVLSHALAQTVVQSYSPSEFHGRIMAIFNMNQVVMTAGSILIGTLSSFLGPRWAVASMSTVGALIMVIILVTMPRARLIR